MEFPELDILTMYSGVDASGAVITAPYQANGVQLNSSTVVDNVSPPGAQSKVSMSFWAWQDIPAVNAGRLSIGLATNFHLVGFFNVASDLGMFSSDGVGGTFQGYTGAGATPAGQWNHVLMSYDSLAGTMIIYINDVNQSLTTSGGTFTMPFGIWNSSNINSGGAGTTLAMSDLWIQLGTYIDFSVTANRRKFICADLGAPSLGSNGELPLGSPPTFFFSGPASGWTTNLGTGDTWHASGTAHTDFTSSPPQC